MSKFLVPKFKSTSHPTTYALLVGIDEYPVPGHRLRGCRNDVEAMEAFLGQFPGERELQVRKLLDSEATRANLIAAWLEFEVAKVGDVCLFYFSGHGSSGESPAVFRHIDVNGRMQSIVCHDSRLAGGRDLTDKELSQLTWQVTYDHTKRVTKDVHLVTIFDCCHAGGNTKEAERDRGIDDSVIPGEIMNYHGYEDFDRQVVRGKVYYSPKRGPHMQLAASGEMEKAKEKVIDGEVRGIYTYFLLEILSSHQGALSYAQVQQALFISIQNETSRQTPQLDAVGMRVTDQAFLNSTQAVASHAYVLSYHKELERWLVQTGQIQGMVPSQIDQYEFFVPAMNGTYSIQEVYLSHAALADFNAVDTSQVFLAELRELGEDNFQFAIEHDLKESLGFSTLQSPFWSFVEIAQEQGYELRQIADGLGLFRNSLCLYRCPLPQSSQATKALAMQLERIANWHRVLAIQNERPRLKPSHYQIAWYRQEAADAYPNEEEAPYELINTEHNQAVFSYRWDRHHQQQQKAWLEPAFRLNFTNKSGQSLYVAALYLQADYKITDRFCPPTLLDTGKSLDFQYRTKKGRLYRSIFLSLYPQLEAEGINSIKEYIKLFISYKPFDIEQLKQDGLYSELVSATTSKDPSKAIGSRINHLLGGHRDWTIETFELTIQKPN
ncbi:MAG: caspase family protein [Cyanothece sp. SIO1E1]|nr:caspase family protein [Cyanothece sp. SIO1E1]